MGYQVVALSSNESKKELATKLGAKHYIVGDADSQAEQLNKLGGAKCICALPFYCMLRTAKLIGLQWSLHRHLRLLPP